VAYFLGHPAHTCVNGVTVFVRLLSEQIEDAMLMFDKVTQRHRG